MKRTLPRFLMLGAAIYFGLATMLFLAQRQIIYPAPPRSWGDWRAERIGAQDVRFTSSDGTSLHGWYLQHPDPLVTVLFCHGNGEHVAFLDEELRYWHDQCRGSVLAFDYRGYGKSGGRPHEQGILQDAEAAQRWLAQRTGQSTDQIVIFGRSIGGAVAVHLAAEQGARGLVLDRTFDSLVEVAAGLLPWLPVRWLLRERYPSIDKIAGYDGPLLQIHGKPDEVIPFASGQRLFEASPSSDKRMLVSESLMHNQPWPPSYRQAVARWVLALVAGP